MLTGILLVMGGIIIALLVKIAFFQVDGGKEKIEPLPNIQRIAVLQEVIDLVVSLAECDSEEENFSHAAKHYEDASELTKEQAEAYNEIAQDAFYDGDKQKERANALSAGDALMKAGDNLVEAAKAWIQAGDHEKAGKAYRAAARCYMDSITHYNLADDASRQATAARAYDDANARAASLGQ